jgi:membrane protease YdiL (CAAX protease family)
VWSAFIALPFLALVQGVAAAPITMIALTRLDPALFRPPFDFGAVNAAFKAQAMSGGLLVATLGVVGVVNIAFVASLAAASPLPWRRRISLPSFRIVPLDAVLLFVGGWGASAAVTSVARVLGAYDGSMLQVFANGSSSASSALAVAIVVAGALTGGSEELLFRGYIQTRLVARYGVMKAVLITSALFGLWHFDLVQGVFAFLFGLLFGIVAAKRGSIATGLVVHIVNNAIAFGSQHLFSGDDDSHATQIASIPIGAAVFVAAFALMWFRTRNVTSPASVVEVSSDATSSQKQLPKIVMVFGVLFALASMAAPFVLIPLVRPVIASLTDSGRKHALAEGRAYGNTHDQRDCVEAALARMGSDEDTVAFEVACLRHAGKVAGFCDDVPQISDVMARAPWLESRCAPLDVERKRCEVLLGELVMHCALHDQGARDNE